MSIQLLPPDVVAQIKSCATITSLNGVICELVKNSLDSGSTKITIDVDYTRGGCVVEDDGLGILPSEFAESGGLGKLYHTSKCRAQTPLHGHQGAFLASLSAVALIFITSRHHQHRSHNSLTMHRSKVISRQTPSLAQHHITYPCGTKVSVRDLFGAMPVRVKQRVVMAEKQGGSLKNWEELKRQIVLLLLSWDGSVAVALRDIETNQKMLIRAPRQSSNDTDEVLICSILSQANLINSDQKDSWVSINASTPKILLSGAISLDPSATKSVQFLSLGIHPLLSVDGQSMLHDEINRLFSNSNFGNEEEIEELDERERNRRANDARFKSDGYTNRELKGGRKGVDRWPKFYIRIQPKISEGLTVNDILDQRGNRLSHVLELLQATIHAFLTKYHFRPKGIRRQPSPRKGKPAITKPIQDSIGIQNINAATSSQPLRSCLKPPKSAPPLDLFGTNIKLPSFHSSIYQVDNSLESRIRSGKPSFPGSLVSSQANINRPSSAPPSAAITSILRPSTPLLSKEGKVVRRPFEEVVEVVKPQPLQSQSPEDHTLLDTQNEMELWVNPITKARFFVNTRTGHTISERAASTPPDLVSQFNNHKRLTRPLGGIPGDGGVTSQWLTNILNTWENPVFQPAELPIPQISFDGIGDQTKDVLHGRNHHCQQIDIDRAFKECSSRLNGRISKAGLKNAKVISQVDNKFVLVNISCTTRSSSSESEMLVIVDQHAADERIRIESLMEELCSPSKTSDSGIATTTMEKSITFDIPLDELNQLQRYQQHFADWGILYDVLKQIPKDKHSSKGTTASSIVVRSLPPLIQERCKQEPRLLVQLIRTELWEVHESRNFPASDVLTTHGQPKHWLEKLHTCPRGIIDMLNSRACRSAIMFNDILTRKQCELLVRKLSDCKFPFQCAHGRPSLVPLVDLACLPQFSVDDRICADEHSYGFGFKAWKESLCS